MQHESYDAKLGTTLDRRPRGLKAHPHSQPGAEPRADVDASLSISSADIGLSKDRVPLRVLHVVNRLDTGGTEYGVLKIISGLGDTEFVQGLCTLRGFTPKLAEHPLLEKRLFVAGQSERGFQFPLFRLARIMRTFRPDIVHSRNWGALEAIPAARLARVPVAIHSEHGYELEMLSGLPARRRLLRRGVYTMADQVFTVSQELRHYHARQAWLSPDRIRVIYNGVDAGRFRPRPELRLNLRPELGIPVDSFVIGSVGRLVRIKDFLTLLRAGECLVRRGVDARIVLVGSGPELSRLQEFVSSSSDISGRVFFLGVSDRVPDLMNIMDTYVVTSICEGMSNTLLEAMACGLPTVATRAGGNPEVVEENQTGCLFSPRDVNGLAENLYAFAVKKELRAQFGESARRRILQTFALERMLNEYCQLYLSLAARRGLLVRR